MFTDTPMKLFNEKLVAFVEHHYLVFESQDHYFYMYDTWINDYRPENFSSFDDAINLIRYFDGVDR